MGTLERLPGITGRKVGITSNHHAPYDLGYTRATMAVTERSESARKSKPQKGSLSSDCKLLLLRKIMTVLNKEVTANYVPAAAVIRMVQALSGFTGCKGCVGGMASQK